MADIFYDKGMKFQSVPFLSLTVLFLAGCGMFQVDSRRPEVPMREVPFTARDGDDLRKRILVLPFIDNELQRSQNVVEVARRTVVEELLNTRAFVVVNNSDIGQDLSTFVKENREYDMAGVSRMAQNLGISAVVEGRVLDVRARKIGDEVGIFRKIKAQMETTVALRVFGAKLGKEIYGTTRKATVETETTRVAEQAHSDRFLRDDPNLVRAAVRKAFLETVSGIVKSVEKLSWEGRIARVIGDRVYINAGQMTGIQVGDILKVSDEGVEIFDPETGVFIGFATGRMKGTVEVVSYIGKDGAMGIIHSGSGFKESDMVELY